MSAKRPNAKRRQKRLAREAAKNGEVLKDATETTAVTGDAPDVTVDAPLETPTQAPQPIDDSQVFDSQVRHRLTMARRTLAPGRRFKS